MILRCAIPGGVLVVYGRCPTGKIHKTKHKTSMNIIILDRIRVPVDPEMDLEWMDGDWEVLEVENVEW